MNKAQAINRRQRHLAFKDIRLKLQSAKGFVHNAAEGKRPSGQAEILPAVDESYINVSLRRPSPFYLLWGELCQRIVVHGRLNRVAQVIRPTSE
jgi:hypothetical protein